jgi:putative spermidine/putrescine transport system ATP-binding protein
LITLTSLTKEFGDATAVNGIDLEIADGEFFSMLGPSGCGKTTTLRMIAGFEEPTSGRIELAGEDVTWASPKVRNVNMVFQNYALFPHMDVWDNVEFGLKIKKLAKPEAKQRIERMIAAVRLEGFESRHPAQLSGGQQQRVAVARALVTAPALVLADEPTGNLDSQSTADVLGVLDRLNRSGRTIVLITHEPDVAEHARRLVRLVDGRIVQDARQAPLPQPRHLAETVDA